VIQLADLPTRRVEAWKYSDLRAALADAPLPEERPRPEHAWGKLDGIIERIAVAQGEHDVTKVRAGEEQTLVERIGGEKGLHASVREIQVLPGGMLTRVVVQSGGGVVLNAAHVQVCDGGVFRQFVLADGAKLARIETHVSVEGEVVEVELNGVYMCGAGRHADLSSVITHNAAGGSTRQLIKGVASKGGRGVFQGKIVVERGANKTDARQHHQGMLLEDGAEIFAKPELMIFADDVQCAHGNTAGGLDDSALFYMRSRGVLEADARALLIEAFLVEAVPLSLSDDVRGELTDRIRAWLRERSS
jgi:Fe-S cluster assembly protein SufD